MKLATFVMALLACASLFGCGDGDGTADSVEDVEGTGGTDGADDDAEEDNRTVAFEILQIVSPQEIITWASAEITQAEFG